MCICVCICANNMQILGFGGVAGVRSGGGYHWGGRGGCGGPGTGLIYIYIYVCVCMYVCHTVHVHMCLCTCVAEYIWVCLYKEDIQKYNIGYSEKFWCLNDL